MVIGIASRNCGPHQGSRGYLVLSEEIHDLLDRPRWEADPPLQDPPEFSQHDFARDEGVLAEDDA